MKTTMKTVARGGYDMGKMKKGFGEMQFLQLPQVQVLSELTKKNLPTAIEDEWGIFACVFNSLNQAKHQFDKAAAILEPKHFYIEPLREVWAAMVEAKRRRLPIEFKCILNYLQDWHNQNKDFLGSLIANIQESMCDPDYIEHYARRIVEKHDGREVLKVCAEGIHSLVGNEEPTTAQDVLLQLERKLRELRQQVVLKENKSSDFSSLADSYLSKLKAISSGEKKPDAVKTLNLYDLDQTVQGYMPGDFIVIGAPTGCGKSATGISLAREIALTGESVFYASLEMTQETVLNRLVAPLIDHPISKLSRGVDVTPEAIEQVEQAFEKLRGLKIAIKKPASNSFDGFAKSLVEAETEFKQKYGDDFKGFRVIVVDYLQLLATNADPKFRTLEIDRASKLLRNLAIDNECTVIALAQMDTETAKGGKEPNNIGCLSYCKTIDHDATQVILMWNEGFADRSKLSSTTYIDFIWVKNRDGSTDRVRMGMKWSTGWLYSMLPGSSSKSYEQDPAIKAKPITQIPDLRIDWNGFEKFKIDNDAETNSDLETATPKGADIEVNPILLDMVTGGKVTQAALPPQEPEEFVEAVVDEDLSIVPEQPLSLPLSELTSPNSISEPEPQQPVEAVQELAISEEDAETFVVDGKTFRTGEVVKYADELVGFNIRVRVIAPGLVRNYFEGGVKVEYLEGVKDRMPEINGNEWIIEPNTTETVFASSLEKLQ